MSRAGLLIFIKEVQWVPIFMRDRGANDPLMDDYPEGPVYFLFDNCNPRVKYDPVRLLTISSSLNCQDRPDLKAGNVVLSEPFAQPLVGLFYQLVQGLVPGVLTIL